MFAPCRRQLAVLETFCHNPVVLVTAPSSYVKDSAFVNLKSSAGFTFWFNIHARVRTVRLTYWEEVEHSTYTGISLLCL